MPFEMFGVKLFNIVITVRLVPECLLPEDFGVIGLLVSLQNFQK